MKSSIAAAVFFALGTITAAVKAQGPVAVPRPPPIPTSPPSVLVREPPEPARARVPRPPPAGSARLAIGYRQAVIPNRGFDTFAPDDRLSQVSLETSYAPLNGQRGALAAGIAWDFGTRSAVSDGIPAAIDVHRLTVPIEARLYLAPWAYAFGRVAPGAAMYQTRITNIGTTLTGSPWVAAADTSAGLSFLVGPHGSQPDGVARVWLTPEVGYGWTQSSPIRLSSVRGPVLVASAPERLPDLALRGVYFRAQIGFTL